MPQKFIKSILDETSSPDAYDVLDFASVRNHIFDNVKTAVQQRFPLTNNKFTLSVDELEYDPKQYFSPAEQADAIYKGGTLGVNLKGRFILIDNVTGKVVSKSGKRTLLTVPYLTDRGTFIRNGHEMAIGYIMRMRPGVYARMRNNGQYEAHVNPDLGTGTAFKVEMNPEDGVFVIRRNTSKIKLYPVLKKMGLTDYQLEQVWGKELLEANRNASPGEIVKQTVNPNIPINTLVKTAEAAVTEQPVDKDDLEYEFSTMRLDPEVTERLLGKPYDTITPYTLLDISSKLLKLSRGEVKSDIRDSLEFQKFYGSPELFAERIVKDGGGVARGLLWKATNKNSLDFLPSKPLNKHIDAVFNETGMAQYIDGSCPIDMLETNLKVTKIGEGGIGSIDSAPEETRYTRDSFLGFIDPIKTPESLSVGLDTYLAYGVRRGKDGLLYNKFLLAGYG